MFIGFSTAKRVPDDAPVIYPVEAYNESRIDPVFRAAAETVTGPTGITRHALTEFLKTGQ